MTELDAFDLEHIAVEGYDPHPASRPRSPYDASNCDDTPRKVLQEYGAEEGRDGRGGGRQRRDRPGRRHPLEIPEDLKHFRATTRDNTVVMGRATYDGDRAPAALPHQRRRHPRPRLARRRRARGRRRRRGGRAGAGPRRRRDGRSAARHIYAAAMPAATHQVLTEVHASPEGDTHYPDWDRSQWRETAREPHHDGIRLRLVGAGRRPTAAEPITWTHDVRHPSSRPVRAGADRDGHRLPRRRLGRPRGHRPGGRAPRRPRPRRRRGLRHDGGVADHQHRGGRRDPAGRRRGGGRPAHRSSRASAPTTPRTPSSSPRRPRRSAPTACCW